MVLLLTGSARLRNKRIPYLEFLCSLELLDLAFSFTLGSKSRSFFCEGKAETLSNSKRSNTIQVQPPPCRYTAANPC